MQVDGFHVCNSLQCISLMLKLIKWLGGLCFCILYNFNHQRIKRVTANNTKHGIFRLNLQLKDTDSNWMVLLPKIASKSKMKSLFGRTRAGPYADTKTTHSEAIWQMGQTVREDSEQNWAQQVFRPWWPHPGPAGNNKNLIFPIPCPLLLPLLTASLKPWVEDLDLWICPSSTSLLPPLSCVCLWHIVLYSSLFPTERECPLHFLHSNKQSASETFSLAKHAQAPSLKKKKSEKIKKKKN